MLVKLINNPWISDKLPDGLTIGNTYECIEVFNSNLYDKYYRIINDNNKEDAWNSCFFEIVEDKKEDISLKNKIEQYIKYIGFPVLSVDGNERKITDIFINKNGKAVFELDNEYLVYRENFNILEDYNV